MRGGIIVIKTKFYSDLTKKFYDVQDDAEKEEAKVREQAAVEQKKKEEKSKRAKEIEDAYKACLEANKKFNELRKSFVKDYGAFHMTYKDDTPKVFDENIWTLFDWFI